MSSDWKLCAAVPGVKDVCLAEQVRFMSHCQMKFICSIFVLVETLMNLFFSFVKMDDVIVLADADLFLVSTFCLCLPKSEIPVFKPAFLEVGKPVIEMLEQPSRVWLGE